MKYVGIIGASSCDTAAASFAYEAGKEIALHEAVLVCGGLSGVMEEACRGCREAGGISLGILPASDRRQANPYVTYVLTTGMGEMRNFLVVRCSDVLISIGGAYGTLSEIAIALKEGKKVISLLPSYDIPGAEVLESPVAAVKKAVEL